MGLKLHEKSWKSQIFYSQAPPPYRTTTLQTTHELAIGVRVGPDYLQVFCIYLLANSFLSFPAKFPHELTNSLPLLAPVRSRTHCHVSHSSSCVRVYVCVCVCVCVCACVCVCVCVSRIHSRTHSRPLRSGVRR